MGKKNKERAGSEPQIEPENHSNGGSVAGDERKKKKKKKKEEEEAKGLAKEGEEESEHRIEEKEIPTVSIAVAGSIIDNTQSFELATRLAGQIARAATIFRIDEVVVFDNKSTSASKEDPTEGAVDGSEENESGAVFLFRILRYLETPQYLRKALFPKHNSLRFVGMLPPLDAPHHLRKHEWASFREGVTLKGTPPNSRGTFVDVGLTKNVLVDETLEPGRRVTVAMGTDRNLDYELPRQVVPSSKPREGGMYWGYRVRYASNITSVLEDCPHKGGYDLLIGTSEHGQKISSSQLSLPTFRHLLIAFGGLAGLEESVEEDRDLKGKKVQQVFHSYLNTCPHQGSRTIRTEEAILISLQYFQEPIDRVLRR